MKNFQEIFFDIIVPVSFYLLFFAGLFYAIEESVRKVDDKVLIEVSIKKKYNSFKTYVILVFLFILFFFC